MMVKIHVLEAGLICVHHHGVLSVDVALQKPTDDGGSLKSLFVLIRVGDNRFIVKGH